jgi:hypothetical protein
MKLKLEQLETRIALDADAVFGPPIPAHLTYVPPPVLSRTPVQDVELNIPVLGETVLLSEIINNTPVQQLEEQHPIPAEGFIDRNEIWDDDLHAMFSAFASDGEITLREARDLVVSTDDGGYTAGTEVWQLQNYIYSDQYNELYDRSSQVFLMLVSRDTTSLVGADNTVGFLKEGIESVQPAADHWFFITQTLRGNPNASTINGGETRI